MKRLFIAVLAMLLIAPACLAREPRRGYRGFFDIDAAVGTIHYDDGFYPTYGGLGLSTSHGYQINNNWFVGAGVMFEPYINFFGGLVPLFAEGRFDKTWGKWTPFADVRLGYAINDGAGDGVYFSPNIGYRFNFGGKVNLNVGAGINFRSMTQRYDSWVYGPDGETIISGHESWTTCRAMFNFRIGIDF